MIVLTNKKISNPTTITPPIIPQIRGQLIDDIGGGGIIGAGIGIGVCVGVVPNAGVGVSVDVVVGVAEGIEGGKATGGGVVAGAGAGVGVGVGVVASLDITAKLVKWVIAAVTVWALVSTVLTSGCHCEPSQKDIYKSLSDAPWGNILGS
jgi:hypothetical protein